MEPSIRSRRRASFSRSAAPVSFHLVMSRVRPVQTMAPSARRSGQATACSHLVSPAGVRTRYCTS